MRTTLHESIEEIAPADWNNVVGRDRLICRHEYLRAIERSEINDCRYFYPVVRMNGRIVAHACIYCISTELDSFAQGPLKAVIDRVRSVWKRFLVLRTVECGTPVALGSTISFCERVDKPAALQAIVKCTEVLAEELSVGTILFRDFDESERAPYDCLEESGYKRVCNLPCARMDIRWRSLEDYLNTMRSQYRCKLQAQMRRFHAGGSASIELVEQFSHYAPILAVLWNNVYRNASEYRREILCEDFFENIDAGLGARSAVLLATVNHHITGFLLLLFDDETLIPLFSGLDYDHSRQTGTYFNLFYEAIRIAIHRGMRRIDLGITTLAPKADLGAVITPLTMYMKHRNPILNRLLPLAFNSMTPKNNLRSRRVFKPEVEAA